MTYPVILYVEDDVNSVDIMRLMLCDMMGYPSEHVVIFTESSRFMERVDSLPQPPTLILLDIHVMPHTGFELLAMLRADARYATTPVVALTASVMNEEVERLRTAGFSSILAKPIDVDTMPAILNRIINGESVWYISG